MTILGEIWLGMVIMLSGHHGIMAHGSHVIIVECSFGDKCLKSGLSQRERQSRIHQKDGFLVSPEGPNSLGSSRSAILGSIWSRVGILLKQKGQSGWEESIS